MDAAPAYLERLQLAVDVRLVDDVRRWPALAEQSRRIVERIAAQTVGLPQRRVYHALSTEERLLHAVAQALGGELDDREARTIHDQGADTDRDVPFVAIVLACRGFDTERARSVYALALADTLSPALAESLRLAFERGFPPARAERLPPRVRNGLLERWPGTTWSRIVRALAGGDRELAELALHQPQLVAGAGPRAIDALVAHGRWRELLERLGEGNADDQRARLVLVARVTAWRTPLPAAPIGIALARSGAGDDATTLALALATGDSAAASQIRREPLLADPEGAFATGLAMLGGSRDDVRALGRAMPAHGGSPVATASTIHAALFALELGDRSAIRELVAPLAALRELVWGRVLLARCYLAVGDAAAVEPLLFRDDGPIAALLRARAMAATQAETARAWLCDLFVEHPGWSEARLRYGLALAATDPRRGIAILEDTATAGADDTAVLGPPATARALAQLAAAELVRRTGATGPDVGLRIRVALAIAPTSPAVARQAATIAVAIRAPDLARDALARLQDLAPSSRAGERLDAALLELAGDLAGATAKYRELGAWDRLAVLAARARHAAEDVALPDIGQLDESPSVAALHGVAVVASARGDLGLAARALERAIARRPDHAGLATDFLAVKLQQAKLALAEGDVADLFYAARDLERAAQVVEDPRLRSAHAALVVALCTRWLRSGDRDRAQAYLEELRAGLDPRRDAAPHSLVSLHLVALELRAGRTDRAAAALAVLPRDPHAQLLRALHALVVDDRDTLAQLVPALASASSPRIRAGARLLDLDEDGDESLAAWMLQAAPGEGPEALGVDAAVHVAFWLADGGTPHAALADYVERVASTARDLVEARHARLVALGLRATMPEPPPLPLDALDLGQLGEGEDRDLAVGLVALELRRRRQGGDKAGAHQALAQLVMLVRPTGAIGVLALASIEDAADAALAAWRAEPDDSRELQAALATGLRRAVARELGGEDDARCTAAWQHVVGLLGPVLVSLDVWETLAEDRDAVYSVPHMELENARAACQRRVADIFVTLGKWHASRGGDAVHASARFDAIRHLLATELSIARSVQTLLEEHGTHEDLPRPLGPIGLDVLGYRARAVEHLGELDTDRAGLAGDVRGVLAGALLDGWIALHDGRLDVAERVARDRMTAAARPDNDAVRLLAAIYVRRIREAYNEVDLNGAADIAAEWVTREQLPELPEELAVEIATVCRALATRYGINPARRRLQQIRQRAGHDVRTLRAVEADLVVEYVDRGRAVEPLERTRLLGEAMALAPADAIRERLQEALVLAIAATKEPEGVDEILALLADACGGDPTRLAGAFVATQVRKSELVDRRLRSSAALELRIEELRRVLDLGRSGNAPTARLLDRLVFLHERLHQIYATAGNGHEAQRHARRAAAYRNWHAEGASS